MHDLLYHIDTDMGVDDGLAFLVADRMLGAPCAVSTVAGNVPVHVATRNAVLYRALLGRTHDWPIYEGAAHASDGVSRDASDVHGQDGLGGATAQVSPDIMRAVERTKIPLLFDQPAPEAEQVTLIGIGPATNIPHLVAWYGASAIKSIVLMSGSFFDLGNITPHAEFNAFIDPGALQATLDLDLPTLMVPLDICRKVLLPRALIADYADSTSGDLPRLIAASHQAYMDFYHGREGIDGCFPHDAITMLAALEPQRLFRLRGLVETACHEKRGQTRFTPDHKANIEVATGGDLKWVRETIRHVLMP